jgi:hypothetical protein
MFQKRHMEALAQTMQELKPSRNWASVGEYEPRLVQWELTVKAIADMLAGSNGNLDRGRFMRACEPGANVRKRS